MVLAILLIDYELFYLTAYELVLSMFGSCACQLQLLMLECVAAAACDLSTATAVQACDLGHWFVPWCSSCAIYGMAADAALMMACMLSMLC